METAKTFIKNSLANYGQKIIRSGIGIVTIGIIARYLSPEVFGQYVYIFAFISISEVTAGMGVPMILSREIAKDKTRAPALIASSLIMQFVLSITTLAIIGLIFYFLAPSQSVFLAAVICAVAEMFRFLGRFFWSIYQGFERMGFGTVQTFVTQSLYLLFLIVAINKDLGLSGIFTATLLAHLTGAAFGYVTVARLFARPKFGNAKRLCKFLLKESYPLAIKGVFRNLSYRAGTLLLAAMRTSVEVGMFAGPYRIVLNLVFASEASSQAIFPIFSRFTVSSKFSLDVAYQAALKFALLIGVPMAVFLSNFSEELVVLILGDKYVEAAPVVRILGWALVPLFLASFVQKILVASNRQGLTTVAMGGALGINILLGLFLIPRMSYTGAGVAAVCSELVVLCLSFYFAWKYLGLGVAMPATVKPLIAGVGTYGVLTILPEMNLVIGGIVEIVVYAIILVGIKTFSNKEISFARELLSGIVPVKATRS